MKNKSVIFLKGDDYSVIKEIELSNILDLPMIGQSILMPKDMTNYMDTIYIVTDVYNNLLWNLQEKYKNKDVYDYIVIVKRKLASDKEKYNVHKVQNKKVS